MAVLKAETLLWLMPGLPLLGFAAIALMGGRLPRGAAGFVGAASVGLAALASAMAGAELLSSGRDAVSLTLWRWMDVAGFSPGLTLRLDALSLVMALVVTGVGFLILLYSAEHMRGDEGYRRFFACMDLFVGSMLVLVLAGDLLFLFLGWEGVGLCSYLLIGFWYRDPANVRAAGKAFVVTRVGDTAMAVGLLLIFHSLGTLDIQEALSLAGSKWQAGSALAVAASALLLAGALGKSAQLPLQTWLPDAMAGPTPVSALIHAATMVTAGVYLIARTHPFFLLAPQVLHMAAVLGAATMLLSGASALAQRDIKRVLAYSTMGQVGYMFLALGVGAFGAAVFHLVTHAFFKALLFLSAGVVIQALKDEHDIYRMGGLRRDLPVAFWGFLAGAASLSALPLVTAGFYSKEEILRATWSGGGPWLWLAGLAGAFLTSLYAFRVVFAAFFGSPRARVVKRPGALVKAPLLVLAALSLAGGFLHVPRLLERALPAPDAPPLGATEAVSLGLAASLVSAAGVYLAYILFLRRREAAESMLKNRAAAVVHRLWQAGWGFDRLYGRLLVRPFLWATRVNRGDFVDLFYAGAAWYSGLANGLLSRSQSGKMRWYAAGLALGAAAALAAVMLI
ncbi:MAG: NADH-quinone oxidoreductase subunit L [Thermodesulfovibrionales bacterium]